MIGQEKGSLHWCLVSLGHNNGTAAKFWADSNQLNPSSTEQGTAQSHGVLHLILCDRVEWSVGFLRMCTFGDVRRRGEVGVRGRIFSREGGSDIPRWKTPDPTSVPVVLIPGVIWRGSGLSYSFFWRLFYLLHSGTCIKAVYMNEANNQTQSGKLWSKE